MKSSSSLTFETFFSALMGLQNKEKLYTLNDIPVMLTGSESEDPEFLELLREYGVSVALYSDHGFPKELEMALAVEEIGVDDPWVTEDYFRVTSEEDRLRGACAELLCWYQRTQESMPRKDSYFYKELPSLAEVAKKVYPIVEAFVKGVVA